LQPGQRGQVGAKKILTRFQEAGRITLQSAVTFVINSISQINPLTLYWLNLKLVVYIHPVTGIPQVFQQSQDS
jgi:hypothetical protein